MSLLELFRNEAVRRGHLPPGARLDPETVFALVRDMPYRRARDRQAETTIAEWRGTCSGKHYLLKELFRELGLRAQVMACTAVTPVEAEQVPEALRPLYEAANRRFVDVHNYLLVDVPHGGQMVVDATWPAAAKSAGLAVNEQFVLGSSQQIAAEPIESWPVPGDRDPQAFKEELLRRHFSAAELEFREIVVQALGEKTGG